MNRPVAKTGTLWILLILTAWGCQRVEGLGAVALPAPSMSSPQQAASHTDESSPPQSTSISAPQIEAAPDPTAPLEERLIEAATEILKLRIELQTETDPSTRAKLQERLEAVKKSRKSLFSLESSEP